MLQLDDGSIETGLRLAVQKFGQRLTLNGDASFQRRTVEIAVASGLKVQFMDLSLERYRVELEQAKRPSRAQPTKPRVPESTALPAQAAEVTQPTSAPESNVEAEPLASSSAPRSVQRLADAQRELGHEVLQVEPGRMYIGKIREISPDGFAVQSVSRTAVVVHDMQQLDGRFEVGQLAEIRYTNGRGVDQRQAIQQDRSIDR